MLQKHQQLQKPFTLLLLLLGIIGLVILLLKKRKEKAEAITKVFTGSPYEQLIPYLIAQSQHETAGWTSNVYKTNNNLFGMNTPSKRPFDGMRGTQAPEGGNYAKYENDEQSARDMKLWLDYTKFPLTVGSAGTFVSELVKRGYFTDTQENYLNAIVNWLKK